MKSDRIYVRVTPEEKLRWGEAAGGERRVSEWIRQLANEAAFVLTETGVSSEFGPSDQRLIVTTPAKLTAAENTVVSTWPEGTTVKEGEQVPPPEAIVVEAAQTSCPNWMNHREGVWCKSCGQS